MAAAYHIFKNGAVVAITTVGRKTNTPHGNPASDSPVGVNKSPGALSPVTGK